MPRRGYTVPPVSGSSVPDFCKVFGTLYSIWAQEHGFGEDVKVIFEPVPPGERPREGAYVIRPTHDVRGEDHPSKAGRRSGTSCPARKELSQ